MNITIHSTAISPCVLGLVPVEGSCDSDITIRLVKNRLAEFGIDMNSDVVASTHDGASVMVKYGRKIQAFSQLCYNHGIHLAVLDVLYRKKTQLIHISAEDSDVNELFHDDDDYFDQDENIGHIDLFVSDSNLNLEYDTIFDIPVIRKDIETVLAETRRIIKFFKRSAIRSSILQKHVFEQEGKKLRLLLDCKTRWNSLLHMINRFLKLINCINKALFALGQEQFDSVNIKVLKEIMQVLEPIELVVKELSKTNINLLIAGTDLANEMMHALKSRINERRNKDIISLLLFLQSGNFPHSQSNNYFTYSSKSLVKLLAKETVERLFCESENIVENIERNTDSEPEISTLDEMQKIIDSVMAIPLSKKGKVSTLEKEFKLIEVTRGKRGFYTEKLYQALLTIQPTSTSSERVFSVASNFLTKVRNQLKMETLDSLVFLKYYFINKK